MHLSASNINCGLDVLQKDMQPMHQLHHTLSWHLRLPFTSKGSSLYNISRFRLLSPILSILAYDTTNRSELDISVDKRPISINFTNISKTPSSNGIRPLYVVERL
ncbi:hypothetical protein MRB53_026755 [Persea americana]|uniref:Uncharacterized protein n=1 Tax=Persea americana TaxID=3435 RepID=A0ACC2LK51_PERAE|nr:hypothetical protein MRB53_026755 [Persea americana]